jgi:hypothetical protein
MSTDSKPTLSFVRQNSEASPLGMPLSMLVSLDDLLHFFVYSAILALLLGIIVVPTLLIITKG